MWEDLHADRAMRMVLRGPTTSCLHDWIVLAAASSQPRLATALTTRSPLASSRRGPCSVGGRPHSPARLKSRGGAGSVIVVSNPKSPHRSRSHTRVGVHSLHEPAGSSCGFSVSSWTALATASTIFFALDSSASCTFSSTLNVWASARISSKEDMDMMDESGRREHE